MNQDGIIDSLFAQQEEVVESMSEEDSVVVAHTVDPDEFALYKKYLS